MKHSSKKTNGIKNVLLYFTCITILLFVVGCIKHDDPPVLRITPLASGFISPIGLETNGRVESILMSLPTNAGWVYDFKTKDGSAEEITLQKLKKGINWI